MNDLLQIIYILNINMAQPPWLGCPVSKSDTQYGRQPITPATMLANRDAELKDRQVLITFSCTHLTIYFYEQNRTA